MRTPWVVLWLSPVSEAGQDQEKGRISPRVGAEPPGRGRGGSSSACVPSEQQRRHRLSLDDVPQTHGKAGNSDNLMSVFAAPLTATSAVAWGPPQPLCCPLGPLCVTGLHHLLLLLPLLVLFHAVHCTRLLICSIGDISSCFPVLLIHREKMCWESLAVEITKFGLSRGVLGKK